MPRSREQLLPGNAPAVFLHNTSSHARHVLLPVRQQLLPVFTLRVPPPGSQMIILKAAAGGEGWLINLSAGACVRVIACLSVCLSSGLGEFVNLILIFSSVPARALPYILVVSHPPSPLPSSSAPSSSSLSAPLSSSSLSPPIYLRISNPLPCPVLLSISPPPPLQPLQIRLEEEGGGGSVLPPRHLPPPPSSAGCVLVEGGAGGDVAWVAIYEGAATSSDASAPATISHQDCPAITVAVTPLDATPRMPSPFTFTAFLNVR